MKRLRRLAALTGWRGLAFAGLMVFGSAQTGFCGQETIGDHPAAPDYQLAGTIEGGAEATGAVFEDPRTKQQKLYRIGDTISGATIIDIKHQRVLLRKGERIEVVTITGGSEVKRAPDDAIRIAGDSDDPAEKLQRVLSQVIPPYDPRVKHLRKAVSREEMTRFVGYFRSTAPAPTFVDTTVGPALGLSDVDHTTLVRLGLEPTDLIVGISGMSIDSSERLFQILEVLDRAKVLDLSVLRGEVIKPLYYAVQ